MKGFKEEKVRGSTDYPFEKYNIISHSMKKFATNHWHDETEIIFVMSGTINITISGNEFEGKAGDIFIINGGEMHEIFGNGTPLSYTAFVFNAEMLEFKKADIFFRQVIDGELLFENKVENDKESFELLKLVDDINEEKSGCFKLVTRTLLLRFFTHIINNGKYILKRNRHVSRKNKLMKKIILYIEENYAQEMSLVQIARHFNMSHKYFCRFFKNNFNKTFVEYLNDVRIENAMRLFDRGMNVTETAISCGFNNMSYFTLVFKRKTGCTPSQYKREKLLP